MWFPSVGRIPPFKTKTIHLKKVDPPKFSGQEIDYPDFFRKWNAIVGPANLPDEAEIDLLRDALPVNAQDMLVVVTKISKAWEILNKRFSDKDLIATKLKGELKTLKLSEKLDYEKVIALVIKVRSLVTRLEALEASEALKYDGEFLSAVYFQLPERQRCKWLDFDKASYGDKWSALVSYLDIAYDQAVQEKLLLATYASSGQMNRKKNNTDVGEVATSVNGSSVCISTSSDSDDQKLEAAKQRVGKCPLCNEEHTFKSKWRTVPWPSDRLIQCKTFNDMNTKERAEALDLVQGCSRCTSWGHRRLECTMPVINCTESVNGSRCHGDHSRLVCNSGVAYCMAAHLSEESIFTKINELQCTIQYMQDIPITSGHVGRVLWDNGSNRVLVNNEFAKECQLKSRHTVVTLKTVGQVKRMMVKMYELYLVDNNGHQHHIWGYGVDNIMDPDDPADLSHVRQLFPYIPTEAFSTLPKR